MKKRLFAAVLTLCLPVLLLPSAAMAAIDADSPVRMITETDSAPITPMDAFPFLTESKEVVITETGTLRDVLEATDDYAQERVTELVISTENGAFLNYADFTYIRTQLLNLKTLDLTDADCINDYDPANPVEHEIPSYAMQYHKSLETIVLSHKVTSIGRGAFLGCTDLRGDLVIPDNITHLSKICFGHYGNSYPQFDSLTLSKNLEVAEGGAFLRCKIKGGLTIPASVESLEGDGTYGGVFQSCGFDGPLVFEEGSKLKTISSYVFSGCSGLTCAAEDIPATVETIGNMSFSSMTKLTGVMNLPNVTAIGSGAFSSCTGLEGVVFGDKLETIGGSAFYNCKGMKGDLVIPDATISIGNMAFYSCYFDDTLTLGNSLETIGTNAFEFNSFTGGLTFPDSMKTISGLSFAYAGFDGPLDLGSGVEYIGGQAFRENGFTGDLVIPDSVTSLGDANYGAFLYCRSFDGTLTLSNSLKWIPDKAFYGCRNLTGNLVIPDSVEKLGPSCFGANPGFTGDLIIPDSVVEVGTYAFSDCTGLNGEFRLGNKIQTIGSNAFNNCNKLTGELVIPDNVETLGPNAFANCRNLTGDVTLPAGLKSIGTYFLSGTGITALRYHGDQITDFGNNNYFGTLNSVKTLDFSGSSVEKLTWTAADPALTEVILPETVKTLTLTSKSALETIDLTGCTELTEVNLSANAIDFSGGKPKEWLDSYTGTKNITNQRIIFYGTPGAAERFVEQNGEFTDDFTIATYQGTDLSTSAKWTAFRSAHQANVAPAAEAWLAANIMSAGFPITRAPSYSAGVKTDVLGVQKITYSTTHTALQNLNYAVELTVGEAETPEVTESIVVKNTTGGVIGSGGFAKTYGDTPFILHAESKSLSGDVVWKVYEDDNGAKGENESESVLSYDTATDLFTIRSAGTAWVTAAIGDVQSAPAKIVVNRYKFGISLSAGKSKTYGTADPVNLGYSLGGRYGETVKASFTREPGEDVGTYQIWLYDPAELNLDKEPGEEGFADVYKAACAAKFEAENPNYALNLTYKDGQTKNFKINAKPLGLSNVMLNAKTYDGTTTAVANYPQPVSGIVTGDLNNGVSVEVTCTFDSADVNHGEDGAVIARDGQVIAVVRGPKVKNYALPSGYTSGVEKSNITWTVEGEGDDRTFTVKKDGLSAKINPPTVTCTIQPVNKVYDGTVAASFENDAMFERAFLGLIPSEQEAIGSISAEFTDKNAGTAKTVVLVSDEINLNNYKLPAFAADIRPAPLSVTGLTAEDKVYDGTADAVIGGTPVIDTAGVAEGDDVSVAAEGELKGEFYDRNAGNKKSVTVSAGFGLEGDDAANYYLRPAATLYAAITPAPLTIVPKADQYKAFGALDPVFTYDCVGLAESDTTEEGTVINGILRGALSRVEGEEIGEYDYTLGTLTTTGNYTLALAAEAPKFAVRDTDATLKAIGLSAGILSPAFNPEADTYTVKLPMGTATVPAVTAEAAAEGAAVSVTDAASLGENTVITVTAPDGESVKTYTLGFTVADTVSVTAAVVNATADLSDGIIVATAAGGLGSYEFSLDNAAWQTDNVFTGLAAGDYVLHVRDAEDVNNAAGISVTVDTKSESAVTVPAPTVLTADPASPVIPFSTESLRVELNADGVEGAVYSYRIVSDNAAISGNTLTVTAPGAVTVEARAIKDGAISAEAKTLTLDVAKAEAVSLTAEPTAVSSFGGTNGSIALAAEGGFGTYQYRIGNNSWQDGKTFSGLKAGIYTVYARDTRDIANVTSATVEVTQAEATDSAAVNGVLAQLTLGDTSAVTESLALPSAETYGGRTVPITWTTSDPSVVAEDGTVTCPVSTVGNKTVTLTATLTLNGITKTATFEVTVIAKDPSYAPFVDVSENAYYSQAVLWAVENGITNGTSATTFSPDLLCTRAQMVTFLWRTAGEPAAADVENPFTDVEEGTYYYEAVLWAVEKGITKGTSADEFSPDAIVTRAQAVTFLWRAADCPTVAAESPFTDVDEDAYYAEAVLWAAENGVTEGTDEETFSPENSCTRSQSVTFLYRAVTAE
ncbi:MAG: leucine-rich repeat protein [Clostridia bacterium]